LPLKTQAVPLLRMYILFRSGSWGRHWWQFGDLQHFNLLCGEQIMGSLWELDISTVMLRNLKAELTQPQLQKGVSTALSNNLQAELSWPQPQKGVRPKCSMPGLLFLRCLCLESSNHRFLMLQCHAPPPRTVAPPPYLPLYVKDLLKEEPTAGCWLLILLLLMLLLLAVCLQKGVAAVVCLRV
jgi:hypothetical protein